MLAGLDAIGGFVSSNSSGGGTAGSFSLDISRETVSLTRSETTTVTLTTSSVTVIPSGGSGGYTYSWSSSDPSISATAPTSATTGFSATLAPGDVANAELTCTVHDSSGAVDSIGCDVTISSVDYR